MKTSSAKAKGRRLQQWIAEQISELLNIPCGKDELITSREMGQSGTDVRLIGEAKERFKFDVEAKNQQSWSVHSWIAQAKKNNVDGRDWLLVCKRNNMDPVVILDAKAFFRILKENYNERRRD